MNIKIALHLYLSKYYIHKKHCRYIDPLIFLHHKPNWLVKKTKLYTQTHAEPKKKSEIEKDSLALQDDLSSVLERAITFVGSKVYDLLLARALQ